ncbi:hypothetical protein DFQ28_007696 [Apophysomyces sp. BC1034]|nr:hypothetical protein DFQ30_004499 [Apophysomyces sp. BC1015]KAG0177170.1 hypothetical protein DFQ29_005168 [Apophysomyces sp. BC1021]KAG0192792.1 hypothetical protein DFQ28_007696 [Apophysomyces sp. BC1034]
MLFQMRSVVMINCGATIDITQLFPPTVTTYIIDNSRPFNLENLLPQHTNVCVFDDAADTERLDLLIDAHGSMEYDSDSDSSASDTNDEDEFGRVQSDRPRQRRRLNSPTAVEQRMQKQEKMRELVKYHDVPAYQGYSSAAIAYLLATDLAQTNNNLLWWAIVGVTAQYVFEHIDTDKYLEHVSMLSDEVARLNVGDDDAMAEGSIRTEDEYKFMLFRHWNLYDSMIHSPYISEILALGTEAGVVRMHNMLATEGISLKQARQQYAHMELSTKKELKKKVESMCQLQGVDGILYPSFSQSFGYHGRLSASDTVYSLDTLLETRSSVALELGEDVRWDDEDGDDMGSTFYTAYDAMGR